MAALKTVLMVVFILISIALTVIVLMQEGKSAGLGAISGAADTYWGKNKGRSMEGKLVDAMIEGKVTDEDAYVARTYKDAPDVDGYLFVQTERELMTGDFVRVRITGSHEYDLIGELEDESAE